jgi:hypothetical protein
VTKVSAKFDRKEYWQGGLVVAVQSTRIEAERCGFEHSSGRNFLVRIGKEARRLGTAKLKQWVACSRPQQAVNVRDVKNGWQFYRLINVETIIIIINIIYTMF